MSEIKPENWANKNKIRNHYVIYLLLTFIVNMKQKQANAIWYSHCVSSLACNSIFRNQEKQKTPAFQEFFDQWFRDHGTKPLTTPFLTPLPWISLPTPKETAAPSYSWLRNPYQTQTNKQSLKDDDNMRIHRSVLRTYGVCTKTRLNLVSNVTHFVFKHWKFGRPIHDFWHSK